MDKNRLLEKIKLVILILVVLCFFKLRDCGEVMVLYNCFFVED